MGWIYKVINNINEKIYIGQTIKKYEKRFLQHKANYDKEYFSQVVLYKAIKQYGIDNFTFTPIEEVENNLLDEREKYWIQYYNSYNKGYNSTLGGQDVQLYNWDREEIISLYNKYKSARKVAFDIGCDHSTIDNLLNSWKITRIKHQHYIKHFKMINKNISQNFSCIVDCVDYIKTNRLSKGTTQTIRTNISKAINTETMYLGFYFVLENE